MEIIALTVALITLAVMLIVFEIRTYRERRDMLDRLMARSLPEYKDNAKPEENTLPEDTDDTVPLEEAEEDFLNNGEKD